MANASRGFIDLHSHLIPGVDDGCRQTSDSLACIRKLMEAGFEGSVCTPHVWPELYPENTPCAIQKQVERLREELRHAGMMYSLWVGGEVRIAPGMIEWLEWEGVPALGSGRFVLIDYWGGDWPDFADGMVDWLLDQEYRPILAHPERMGLEDAKLKRVTASLLRRGVLLQGNLRSLAGGEGSRAQRQLEGLLQRGEIFALSTDVHSLADTEGRLDGIVAIDRLLGPDAAETLLGTRPREVVPRDGR
jgi:protein-tyrosine phosphatase